MTSLNAIKGPPGLNLTDEESGGLRDMTVTRGWKCFNADLTCNGFKFEVGKTYVHVPVWTA